MRVSLIVLIVLVIAGAIFAHVGYNVFRPVVTVPTAAVNTGRPPNISPDYSGCTVPPNIAPLNFHIVEPGVEFRVKVHCPGANGLVVAGRSPSIVIPPAKWRDLLTKSRGKEIRFEVYVRNKALQWRQFKPITNTIAMEPIDPYMAYRHIGPVHVRYNHQEIRQRNLETYDTTPIHRSPRGTQRCINCHTFIKNDPSKMVLHIRGSHGVAMLLGENDTVKKINTRTKYNSSPASYTSWHPSGQFAAFSVHKLTQLFHSTGFARDVFDYASDIGFYFVDDNRVFIPTKVATKDHLEIFPTWSWDGKWFYFCRTKKTWEDGLKAKAILPDDYEKVRYDLMRASYDIETNTLGELETVLSSADVGRSILEPRVSPDGRFVLVTMCDHGNFPVYMETSDLYMLDLESGELRPLEQVNSNRADTWHCWSTNGRWIVFASKRQDGLFGRPFFSYIDESGQAAKPFVLPQKDPLFYDSFLYNYNAPEFITGPVTIPEEAFNLAIAATKSGMPVKPDTDKPPDDGIGASPIADPAGDSMWKPQ